MNAPNQIENPSPKQRFRESNENIARHRALVDSREFQRACDFALLEFQNKLCHKETNPSVLGLKLVGAQEFLTCFRLISEAEIIRSIPRVDDNLPTS